jgi:hypothetical protein
MLGCQTRYVGHQTRHTKGQNIKTLREAGFKVISIAQQQRKYE